MMKPPGRGLLRLMNASVGDLAIAFDSHDNRVHPRSHSRERRSIDQMYRSLFWLFTNRPKLSQFFHQLIVNEFNHQISIFEMRRDSEPVGGFPHVLLLPVELRNDAA